MAQIPRNLPAAAPTNVPSGRLQGGPRSVATADASPIDELSPQDSVLFNDALLYQEEQAADRRGGDRSRGNPVIEYAGTAQTFAAVFEEGNAAGSGGDVQRTRSRGFANLVARAINTYETNVRVIQGTAPQLGSNLSLTL